MGKVTYEIDVGMGAVKAIQRHLQKILDVRDADNEASIQRAINYVNKRYAGFWFKTKKRKAYRDETEDRQRKMYAEDPWRSTWTLHKKYKYFQEQIEMIWKLPIGSKVHIDFD